MLNSDELATMNDAPEVLVPPKEELMVAPEAPKFDLSKIENPAKMVAAYQIMKEYQRLQKGAIIGNRAQRRKAIKEGPSLKEYQRAKSYWIANVKKVATSEMVRNQLVDNVEGQNESQPV